MLELEGSDAALAREKSASAGKAAAVDVDGSGEGVGSGAGRSRAAREGLGGVLASASWRATCSCARRATSAFEVGGV